LMDVRKEGIRPRASKLTTINGNLKEPRVTVAVSREKGWTADEQER